MENGRNNFSRRISIFDFPKSRNTKNLQLQDNILKVGETNLKLSHQVHCIAKMVMNENENANLMRSMFMEVKWHSNVHDETRRRVNTTKLDEKKS
jgi:hypothetical protein